MIYLKACTYVSRLRFQWLKIFWLYWLWNNIEQGVQNSCWISKGLFLIQQHYSKNLEVYDCVIYNTTTERYKGVSFGRIVLFWSTVFVQCNSLRRLVSQLKLCLDNVRMVPLDKYLNTRVILLDDSTILKHSI